MEISFRLGPDIGDLLLNIAQDSIEAGNPERAIEIYMLSLPGFSEDYISKLLRGELELSLCGNELELSTSTAKKDIIRDWDSWLSNKMEDISNTIIGIFEIISKFSEVTRESIDGYDLFEPVETYFGIYASTINIHNIAAKLMADQSLQSSEEDTWANIESKIYSDSSENFERMLYFTVNYIKQLRVLHSELVKVLKSYEFLNRSDLLKSHYPKFEYIIENAFKRLRTFYNTEKIYNNPICDPILKKFKEIIIKDLKSIKIGNEWLTNGILEKDIIDEYEAGWLSPEGKFYGLPKESTGLIHMAIAEQLYFGLYAENMNSDGVSMFGRNNPEYWLETHGWIKIHCQSVRTLYDCKPTDHQIQQIIRYGKVYSALDINNKRTRIVDLKNMEPLMIDQLFSRW